MSAVLSTVIDKPVRIRRTRHQIDQLDQQILDELDGYHPQSIRHVFYRMTNPRLPEPVAKSEKGYRHIQYRITELRRSGRLPYGWITDATRRGYFVNTFNGLADFLTRMNGLYRADLWQDSQYYLEVWVESRSIAGVVENLCQELAVSLYPAGGFSSITLAYDAAGYINSTVERTGKKPVIAYIGDYDPAGVLIDRSIEKELREHLDAGIDLQFERLAITEAQIALYDLPGKPRKEGDKRALHVKETVEAEALPATILLVLLRDFIEGYLPERALEVARVAEESERSFMLSLAERLWEARP